MSAESPPESVAGLSQSGTSNQGLEPRGGGGEGVLETEQQLNSPTRLTLRLLGVIFAATLIPWASAKVACNRREAPTRVPLEQPTEVLAKQAKSAGLELQQRAASFRFREAAELAKGAAADELLAADARCQAEPQPCEQRRAQSGRVFTRAVLVSRSAAAAQVRAESHVEDQVERVAMQLELEGGRWYVVSRVPFAGELTEPLAAPPGGGASPMIQIIPSGVAPSPH
jgi:hypothetical protein